jgi:sorbitol-specific phosphotransferase system component IIBC
MPVDERARHLLYRKLESVLGSEEAGTLMDHLPPSGFANLATKDDVLLVKSDLASLRSEMSARMESVEHRLTAKIEQSARRLVMWTSSMVVAAVALAFAAGRFV